MFDRGKHQGDFPGWSNILYMDKIYTGLLVKNRRLYRSICKKYEVIEQRYAYLNVLKIYVKILCKNWTLIRTHAFQNSICYEFSKTFCVCFGWMNV